MNPSVLDQVVECYDTSMPETLVMSNFTNEDRKALIELGSDMRYIRKDFEDFREEIRKSDSPTRTDYAELKGKVEALQNFRWYLMGASAGIGMLVHFIFK